MMWNTQEWIIYGVMTLLAFTYWRYRNAVSMVSNFPGLRLPVSPMSALGLLLPALPFPFITYPGFSFPWELKHKGLFAKFKCDTVSLCAGDSRALLFTADVPFITQMSSFALREVFPKPVEEYKVLSYLGSNLVICEGESWRRQRRIGAPAFSKGMFEKLWLDMRDIVKEMVEEQRWMERTSLEFQYDKPVTYGAYTFKKGEVFVPHVVDLTLRMALAAIARAGFGMDFQWDAEESFTRVCQTFGNPHRPAWWLVWLQSIWAIGDIVTALIQPCFAFLYALLPAKLNSTVNFTWRSLPLAPLRWTCVVLLYFIAEIWTWFSRPTDLDFNPRDIKVHEALHLVAKDSTLRLAVPAWVMHLPLRRMRRMRLAFSTLEEELKRLTNERKSLHLKQSQDQEHLTDDRGSDLLSNLVKAAMMDEGDSEQAKSSGSAMGGIQKGLTDEEIIGNAYIYFLAGHETTAHSLAWTLALLAAYPEHQEAAANEISKVWSSNSNYEPFDINTTMDDYAKFPFVLACYSETLRLFPPVQMIPKVAARDVSITVQASNVMEPSDPEPTITSDFCPTLSNAHSTRPSSLSPHASSTPILEKNSSEAEMVPVGTQPENEVISHTSFVVKKGTIIFVDPPGVHYNPRYWKDPEVFDPNRFLRPYNKDAFIPFGVGNRKCLGRMFSEVESVAMLVHLLRNYSVHLVPTSADGSIDVASARAKFSQASVRITLTPTEIPLIFKRRCHY